MTLALLLDGSRAGKIESALTQENKTQTATSIAVLQTLFYCIALCGAVCGVGTFQVLHNILDLHKHSVILCKHPDSAAVQCIYRSLQLWTVQLRHMFTAPLQNDTNTFVRRATVCYFPLAQFDNASCAFARIVYCTQLHSLQYWRVPKKK